MKTFKYLAIVLAGFFIFVACQKELSFETGTLNGIAIGSLKNLAGDCQDITVAGQYIKDSTLRDSSYVTVQVNFTSPGLYNIYTDTENGFSFRDSGYIVATGVQSIKLKAVGKPLVTQVATFTVYLDTSYCTFSVNVTDTAVAKRDADFTLAATGTSCANASVQGTYTAATALDASKNTVNIDVNVTHPGYYKITAGPINGMTFSDQGIFSTTGVTTVTLNGIGTPTTAETDSIPVSAGGTSCKFGVVVGAASTGGGGGTTGSSTWAFTRGTAYSGNFTIATATTITGAGTILLMTGTTVSGDTTFSASIQFPGTAPAKGTFNTNTLGGNSFSFTKSSGEVIYKADYTTSGANIVFTVTDYNTTTKVLTGTFTGTAKDAANASVSITAGTFRVVLQ